MVVKIVDAPRRRWRRSRFQRTWPTTALPSKTPAYITMSGGMIVFYDRQDNPFQVFHIPQPRMDFNLYFGHDAERAGHFVWPNGFPPGYSPTGRDTSGRGFEPQEFPRLKLLPHQQAAVDFFKKAIGSFRNYR